ncbi:PREDICTED: L-ascorbate oxidase-like [Branchiostoma belcheri]|uniref:ferroxidase n=1 Tax=Branchiostoma belcheri TaxID=7741 RepID=A0A6P4ZW98_BRABE|nr:PREDICTED: L-ascorbate oxidase-like [Branchiostoma belcheri]
MHLLRALVVVCLCVSMATAQRCTDDVCEFTLAVRYARTMTHTARNGYVTGVDLLTNGSLKVRDFLWERDGPIVPVEETITADGAQRNVILVNGQFPGPTLEVMEGAQVIVTVVNNLLREATTLHFHGMHMRGVPYMDGVPYVTQCPILPMHNFTYRFKAEPAGTHWYHGHMGSQKVDGLYGAFIVHKNSMPTKPSLPLFLQDWWHEDFNNIDVDNGFMDRMLGPGRYFVTNQERAFMFDGSLLTAIRFESGLINGRGRSNNNSAPLTRCDISPGETLRLRLIHAGAEYTFRLSIDAHSMTVVAADGHDVTPVQVQSILVFPGESYDFEVTGDQPVANYWIRAETPWAGKGPDAASENRMQDVKAILAYDGARTNEDPVTTTQDCTEDNPCRVLNCPFPAFPQNSHAECLYATDLRSTQEYSMPDESETIQEYFFSFGLGSTINFIKFDTPKAPLILNTRPDDDFPPCETTCGFIGGCWCRHVMKLPHGKTIRFVLMNLGVIGYGMHHSVHLHGYDFRVLAMGFPDYNETTGRLTSPNADIYCGDSLECSVASWNGTRRPNLNFNRPPVRDTVVVPAFGYTVIEIRSNNPGFWFFHCHQTTHQTQGMAMVFAEALDKLPALPHGFPTCGDFTGDEKPSTGESGEGPNGQSGTLAWLDETRLVIIILAATALSAILTLAAVRIYHARTGKSKEKVPETPETPRLLGNTVPRENGASQWKEDTQF